MYQKYLRWLKVIVSTVLLGSLIYIVDWGQAWDSLRYANFFYILYALAFEFCALLFAAIRWSLCLKYLGSSLRLPLAYKGYLVGLFYNIFLPGAIGGDVVRVGFAYYRCAGTPLRITGSVVIERALGLMATLVIACLGLLCIGTGTKLGRLRFVIPLTGLAMLMGIISLLFLGPYISEIMKKRYPRIRIVQNLSNKLSFLGTIKKSSVLLLFILSSVFVLINTFAFFLWAKAIGIHKPFSVFLFVMPVTYIITVLPISIGGLGVREGTLSFLLYKFGVILNQCILFAFMLYLNKIFLGVPGGILQLLNGNCKDYRNQKVCNTLTTDNS